MQAIVNALQAIENALYPIVENSVEEISEYGYPFSSEEISYRWAVNGNILSLVILNSSAPDWGGGNVYMVYNIDISSGEEVSTASVIQAAGFSEEEYYENAATYCTWTYVTEEEYYDEI